MTTDIDIKSLVRTIPDYPKPGIMFRDVTTLFGHPSGFRASIEQLVAPFHDQRVESVAGIEARGFILGGAAADRLRCGFVPIRKQGKLPHKAVGQDYELEYGNDAIEMHKDSVNQGSRVLIVDDLLATGGTMKAACEIIEKAGGDVVECAFIVDLPDLKGREKLKDYQVFTLVEFEGE